MNYPWEKRQCFEHNLLFIHIHKCGGSSIKDFFSGNTTTSTRASHSKASDIIKQIGVDKFNKYTSFTLVRNPYDRAVSGWSYRCSTGRLRKTMLWSEYVNDDHFKLFPYRDYLFHNNNMVVNEVLKLESLATDLDKFLSKYGLSDKFNINDFPQSRKSTLREKKPLEYFFSDKKIKDKVLGYYKEDFELFGYEK